jgi:hypothetical protein
MDDRREKFARDNVVPASRSRLRSGIAEKMTDPLDKAAWLKVATEWLKLLRQPRRNEKVKVAPADGCFILCPLRVRSSIAAAP